MPFSMSPEVRAFVPLLLVLSPIGLGQNTSAAPGDSPNPVSTPSSASTGQTGPLSDYVPCIFSDDEQGAMRAQPPFQRPLDQLSAQRLLDATYVALARPLSGYRQAQKFQATFQDQFQKLDPKKLVGLTADQANTRIQRALVDAVQTAAQAQAQVAGAKALRSDSEKTQNRSEAADYLFNLVKNAIQTERQKPAGNFIAAGKQAIVSASNTNVKFSVPYLNEVAKLFEQHASAYPEFRFSENPNSLANLAGQAALDAAEDPYVESADFDLSRAIAELTAAVGASADIAAKKTAAKTYQPPEDVSCSMSLMSWKETRDVFGRRVANTFVGIQVNLRNLNNKNEFLVHDIQVAIDTGVKPEDLGRFQAGRDKLLVRAVAQRGQSEDRRNIVVNVLQAAGAIAGAASVATGITEAKDAVAVFQGAFIPGFSNIFPDHTVEQLNHINDLVFSASNTSKIVVPVQGSVPLVTFIAEKPIEQLPFAWCGHPNQGKLNPARWLALGPLQNCNFNPGNTNPDDPGYPDEYHYGKHGQIYKEATEQVDGKNGDLPWSDLHYRDWRAAALRMLQKRTFVVVGGVHIQQVTTQPKLANLDCPLLTGGQIDISKVTDGMVTCSVTGNGLGLVNAVTIEKGDAKVAGKIKAANDGNSATIQFKPDDLYALEGLYSLHMTYRSDAQKDPRDLDSGESLSLAKQPLVTKAEIAAAIPSSSGPTTTRATSALGYTLTLTGKGLDQLQDIFLVLDSPNGDKKTKGDSFTPTATSATINFSGLNRDTKYYVTYSSKAQQNKQSDSGQSVTTAK